MIKKIHADKIIHAGSVYSFTPSFFFLPRRLIQLRLAAAKREQEVVCLLPDSSVSVDKCRPE